MDKLRIGIIGTGHIARHHVAGYQYSGRAEIRAATDIDGTALANFCDAHGVPGRFADYHDLLALDEIDAVSVCLPPFLHAPVSIDALNAGKHVLCEKPMCCTVEEAEGMVAAAKATDRTLMVHYRYRFTNAHRKAKEIIESGALGRIYFAKSAGYRWRGRAVLDHTGLGRWFMDPEKAGSGVLFDLGGYTVDLVFWLLGFPEVKSVNAATYQEIDRERAEAVGYRVEEMAMGMVRLADGGTVWLERAGAVNVDPARSGGTLIFGDRAGLNPGGPVLYRPDAGGEMETVHVEVARDPERATHIRPPAHFVESVLAGRPVGDCSGEEGLYVQRILNGMLRSAQEGREVRFGGEA